MIALCANLFHCKHPFLTFPRFFSSLTSIAFKPAESGWGGGSKKYETNFDRIFGSKTSKASAESTGTASSPSNPSTN
jgi:hypothetical protein